MARESVWLFGARQYGCALCVHLCISFFLQFGDIETPCRTEGGRAAMKVPGCRILATNLSCSVVSVNLTPFHLARVCVLSNAKFYVE